MQSMWTPSFLRFLVLGAVLPGLTFAQTAPAPAAAPAAVPALATARVELREVDLSYPADASVEAVNQATVAAQVSGRIVDLRVDAGDAVKKGQLLLRIDTREAAGSYAASQAQLANARAHYERTKDLYAQKFVARAALDKAEADYRAAQADAGAAGAAASHGSIVSPLTGFVAQRFVEAGEMAAPGRPLLSVYDPKGLRVIASIPQYKLAEVRASRSARVEFPERGEWFDALRVEVLPAADPRTHTVTARVFLPGMPAGIIPGLFARVHFVSGKVKKLIVPAAAILRRGEVTAVYVVDDQQGVRLRQVRLSEPFAVAGAPGGRYHEVLAGLVAGEEVALDPVKAGLRRGAPHGTAATR